MESMIKASVALRAWGPIALLSAALVAAPAQAQRGGLKVGVVNLVVLVEQSPQYQQMTTTLETEFAPRQREILTLQQELQKQQETFQRDASVMGEQERADLERRLSVGQRELQRAGNEYREDLNIRQNEEINKVQRAVLQEVQNYARGENYDLIVAEAVYFSSGIDITEAVLESMQRSSR
jgi:outer membrane protein